MLEFTLHAGPNAGQPRPAILIKDNGDGTSELGVITSASDQLTPTGLLRVARAKVKGDKATIADANSKPAPKAEPEPEQSASPAGLGATPAPPSRDDAGAGDGEPDAAHAEDAASKDDDAPPATGNAVADLDLPDKVKQALTAAGIVTVAQVKAHADLTLIDGIGPATVKQIEAAIGAR